MMKRFVTIGLCLLLAAMLMIPAMAAEPEVVLASGARFNPGSKLTVDIQSMTDMDARIYEAWLEGTVAYQWYSGGNPIPGATGQSYTVADSDKIVKVEVRCGDLVLTSSGYIITKTSIVVTKKTTVPTTKAPTKAPTKVTTKAPTQPASTVVPDTAPVPMPAAEPVTQPATTPTAAPSAAPTTVPTQQGRVSEQPTVAEPFPWWTVVLVSTLAVGIICAAAVLIHKKKV